MLAVLVLFSLLSGMMQPEATASEYDVREKIVYAQVGERELLLDAFVPKSDGEHPAVLVVHGGAWRSGDRKQLRGYATALAERGFVCFAIDYRLAPQHKFPAQIDDCRTAVKWVRDHAADFKVDSKRLGAIGYSAGGHLVCLLGTTGEAPLLRMETWTVDCRRSRPVELRPTFVGFRITASGPNTGWGETLIRLLRSFKVRQRQPLLIAVIRQHSSSTERPIPWFRWYGPEHVMKLCGNMV